MPPPEPVEPAHTGREGAHHTPRQRARHLSLPRRCWHSASILSPGQSGPPPPGSQGRTSPEKPRLTRREVPEDPAGQEQEPSTAHPLARPRPVTTQPHTAPACRPPQVGEATPGHTQPGLMGRGSVYEAVKPNTARRATCPKATLTRTEPDIAWHCGTPDHAPGVPTRAPVPRSSSADAGPTGPGLHMGRDRPGPGHTCGLRPPRNACHSWLWGCQPPPGWERLSIQAQEGRRPRGEPLRPSQDPLEQRWGSMPVVTGHSGRGLPPQKDSLKDKSIQSSPCKAPSPGAAPHWRLTGAPTADRRPHSAWAARTGLEPSSATGLGASIPQQKAQGQHPPAWRELWAAPCPPPLSGKWTPHQPRTVRSPPWQDCRPSTARLTLTQKSLPCPVNQ